MRAVEWRMLKENTIENAEGIKKILEDLDITKVEERGGLELV